MILANARIKQSLKFAPDESGSNFWNKQMSKTKANKLKTNKSLMKKIKVTKTGKLMRSHQLRSGHLRAHKSKSALRRHAVPMQVNKTVEKIFRKMLGI